MLPVFRFHRGSLPFFATFAVLILVGAGCLVSPRTDLLPTPTPIRVLATPTQPPAAASSQTQMSLPNVSRIVKEVRPAVVSVVVETLSFNIFMQPIPEEGAGSGIILDPNGYILTNDHVVRGARGITVTLDNGSSFQAQVVGRDTLTDLAVLKIEATGLPTATLGDSSRLQVGDWVVAVGNALGLEGGPTVTVGVIGALGRSIVTEGGAVLFDLIQTDAAINPGNSGGPLVNLAGEVIGINTTIIRGAPGIGFAASSNVAHPIYQDLLTSGKVSRPYHGVDGLTISPGLKARFRLPVSQGVLVWAVASGSPADKAGVREGDIILSVVGTKVTSREQLEYLFWLRHPGDQVELILQRSEREFRVVLTLGTRPG